MRPFLNDSVQVFRDLQVGSVTVSEEVYASRGSTGVDIAIRVCREYGKEEFVSQGELATCMREVAISIIELRWALYNRMRELELEVAPAVPIAPPPPSAEQIVDEAGGGEAQQQALRETQARSLATTTARLGGPPHESFKNNSMAANEATFTGCALRHAHLLQEHWAQSYPGRVRPAGVGRSAPEKSDKPRPSTYKGAIVILTQAGEHSSYANRKSLPCLTKTLNLLYKNYNDEHKDDVIIFHEGDFDLELQNKVRAGRPEIRFFTLRNENWAVEPEFVKGQRFGGFFSLGYMKMIRWYAVRIWPVLHDLGYTWVLRLDDDSLLLSPIRYNLFSFMEHHNYQYAYRNLAMDIPSGLIYDYTSALAIELGLEAGDKTRHLLDTCVDKGGPVEQAYTFKNCGPSPGYYNNFFIANVSRWLEPDVQHILRRFDESGVIFLERWNDLTIQSIVVRLLFEESQIHHFTGFAYSHFGGGDPYRPRFGIMQAGALEEDQLATVQAFAVETDLSEPENQHLFRAGLRVLYNSSLTLSGRVCDESRPTVMDNPLCLC